MAVLDYVTQTDTFIRVDFSGMPEDPALVFVNTTSGTQTPSRSNALSAGGSGSGNIPIEPTLSAGSYCLRAQTRDKPPQFIAQTVVFYLHKTEVAAVKKLAKSK